MQKPFLAADGTSPSTGERRHRRGDAVAAVRTQVELREAEQRAFDLFLQNLVKGTSHLSLGQEAIAAGFANAMNPATCRSAPTGAMRTRSHARGCAGRKGVGELMQRDNGLMRRQGRVHAPHVRGAWGDGFLCDHRRATLPDRCGWRLRPIQARRGRPSRYALSSATAHQYRGLPRGADFAAVWKLPSSLCARTILYMEYTPIGEVTAVKHPAADRAAAYGLEPHSHRRQ